MKRNLILMALLLVLFFVFTSGSYARDYKRGKDDCPWRIAAYILHPFGMALEYAVTRPVHWVVKQSELNKIFGSEHSPEDVSFVWE